MIYGYVVILAASGVLLCVSFKLRCELIKKYINDPHGRAVQNVKILAPQILYVSSLIGVIRFGLKYNNYFLYTLSFISIVGGSFMSYKIINDFDSEGTVSAGRRMVYKARNYKISYLVTGVICVLLGVGIFIGIYNR